MAGDENEPEVRVHDPMPPGYVFVPKGDTVYVVVNKRRRPIGLRCPASVVKAVQGLNQATAAKRAKAVQKRDTAIEDDFEEALKRLFPNAPKESIPKIVSHALKKRSRRVGRSGKVQLDDKVMLAVRAHIRHQHTEYEQLLRQGTNRKKARIQVFSRLNEVARLWGGRPAKSTGLKRKAGKDGDNTRTGQERSELHKRQRKEETFETAATNAKTARPTRKLTVVEGRLLAEASRRSKVFSLHVQTRRMAREGIEPLGGTEEEPIVIDDSDGQEAVFTRGEDTDFDDGDESDWSNWSDISFGNPTGKMSQQNDHHWSKPCLT